MRQPLTLSFILLSLISIGQSNNNNTGIPIPMKNGIIFYEQVYPVTGAINKEELYKRAARWFTQSFPDSKETIKEDKANWKISGKGIFRIITKESEGHYYWLKPDITISVTDSGYSFQSYNYYEKPIMPGVTNDYSKIEYRWWDFRKGKPWNPEDEALFKGLDQHSLLLMASLETEMTK